MDLLPAVAPRRATRADGRLDAGTGFRAMARLLRGGRDFYMKFLPQAKEAAKGDAKVLAVIQGVEDDRLNPWRRVSRPRNGRRSTSSTRSATESGRPRTPRRLRRGDSWEKAREGEW